MARRSGVGRPSDSLPDVREHVHFPLDAPGGGADRGVEDAAPSRARARSRSWNLTTAAALNTLLDPTGLSNLSGDPLFRAPAATPPDYHLTQNSPCRNKGTAAGAPSFDLGGQVRPDETAHDLGAEEFYP